MDEPLLGHVFIRGFIDKAIVPESCRRMVIDVQACKPVIVYYECYGSDKLLEMDIPGSLEDAVKINVAEKKGT